MDSAETRQNESNFTESVINSSSPLLSSSSPPPTPYDRRNTLNIGFWQVSLFWANVLFAIVAVASEFCQMVLLPLWIDSTKSGNSSVPTVDNYFVLSFSSLSFVVIFGLGTLFIHVLLPRDLGETERSFPHLLLFLIGFCDALNGVLTVFASNRERTPRYLQAILGTSMVPLIILFRRVILRKVPTLKKLLCAGVVVIAPVVYLIPKVHGVSSVLWPLIFTISMVPAALMNVLGEKGVKMQHEMSRRGINLVYFLFWTSTYQFLCIISLFWLNVLPWCGSTTINDFGKDWWYGLQCFFGAAGCNATSGTRGTMFILMHVLSFVGTLNLLRHSEGATWVAIVKSPLTPLGFIFWSFFSEEPFKRKPDGDPSNTRFAIGALVIIFVAILIYISGAPEISLNDERSRGEEV